MVDFNFIITIFTGFALVVAGWIWSIVVAWKAHVGWAAAMALLFFLTLPIFAVEHWSEIKKPFMITLAGIVITLGSLKFFAKG